MATKKTNAAAESKFDVWALKELGEGLFLPETARDEGLLTEDQVRECEARRLRHWRESGEAATLPVLLRALDLYATAHGYNDVGEVLRWLDAKSGTFGGDSGNPLDVFRMPGEGLAAW